jgi:hypothetical protein
MKKFYFLTLFLALTLVLNAQTEVTFAVDMNTEVASSDGVFISGNLLDEAGFGSDWQEPGSNTDIQLSDDDGDGVYSIVLTLAAGDYQYKFSNGSGWPNAEAGGNADNYQADLSSCGGTDNGFGGYNRNITIPDEATFTVPVYEFNSCIESSVSSTDNLTTISNLTIAPNPASDFININYTNANNVTHDIIVASITGQVLKQFYSVAGNNQQIDVKDLAAGMYFVTFRNDKGEQGTEKFIVR